MEGLLDAYAKDVEGHKADEAVLLAAAAVELLRVHALLADHAVALGSVDKLLRVLAAHVPPSEGQPSELIELFVSYRLIQSPRTAVASCRHTAGASLQQVVWLMIQAFIALHAHFGIGYRVRALVYRGGKWDRQKAFRCG